MLDIQFIREHPDEVAKKSKQKGYKVDIDFILQRDKARRELLDEVQKLQQERNQLAQEAKGKKPSQKDIERGKQLKEHIAEREAVLKKTETELNTKLKEVPNMPLDDVPIGASEAENKAVKSVGKKPTFSFKPKTHGELLESNEYMDKERAAKVAGARFVYVKGGLVELQFAIIQFVLHTLTDEKLIKKLIQENTLKIKPVPFVPILPPVMLKTDVFDAMDRLEPRDDRYKVGEDKDDLWLVGSAEHTMGPMYKDEILQEETLPLRYIGYSSSFRREAGTYGKDTEGLVRLHQFDKLEMETFSTAETGKDEHLLMIALQQHMMQQLGLHYRLIMKCTADIGKPNARGVDIEVWMPGENRYLETHTADYMTDYQARRLKTRVRTGEDTQMVHMNDATAFALGRIMAAIVENYQQKDGGVKIPRVLQQFMGGKETI